MSLLNKIVYICIFNLLLNLSHPNLCSPCNNIRAEADHKRADECADLLGGPQPPPLLLVQAFLAHTVKVHRYHYPPGSRDHRRAHIMKENTCDEHGQGGKLHAVNSVCQACKWSPIHSWIIRQDG